MGKTPISRHGNATEPDSPRGRSLTPDRATANKCAKESLHHPFGAKGLSGGALLDLGEFTSLDSYDRDPRGSALVSGMVMEYHKEHRALVAVRIDAIVRGIRIALAQIRDAEI